MGKGIVKESDRVVKRLLFTLAISLPCSCTVVTVVHKSIRARLLCMGK